MENPTRTSRDHRLAVGFVAGAAVGAGLMMWLAPRATSELRQRVTGAVKGLRKRASDRYEDASAHVDEVMDEAAEAVARGAREVERRAKAAKSDHVA